LIAAERNGSGDGDDNGEKWDQGDKGVGSAKEEVSVVFF
jgi:hypothetical protein